MHLGVIMKKLWEKIKKEFFVAETLRYLIVGLICTFFNLGAFGLFKVIFDNSSVEFFHTNSKAIAYAIGAAIAALVAFAGNKIYVFKSKSWKPKVVIKEFFETVGSRFFIYVVVTLATNALVDRDILHFVPYAVAKFGWTEEFAKNTVLAWFFRLFLGAIEIAFNYLINKLLIFRKKKGKPEAEAEQSEGESEA